MQRHRFWNSSLSRRSLLAAAVAIPSSIATACDDGSQRSPHGRPVAGPSGSDPSAASPLPSGQIPPASSRLDVRSFGAVGDGKTDDTAALQRALRELESGQTLVLPAAHTFLHSVVLAINTKGASLVGPGTLSASQEGTSALQVLADDVTVAGLTLTVQRTTRRWSAPDQHKLFVGSVTGTVVRNVDITGSAAAGLFGYGAAGFRFEDVRVSGTRADGIHLTNGSHDGQVTRPHVSHSGDDGVAVVSYEQDGKACLNITVDSPVIRDLDGGRGLSVVGGSGVTYQDIDVEGSWAASVYVACEGSPYDTYPTTAVRVLGGRITNANTDASTDHGAVLVYSGRAGGSVTDVTISGLIISGTRATASRQIGAVSDGGGQVADVRFSDLTLAATPTPYEGNVPVSDLTLTRVLAAGKPVAAS